MDSDSFWFIFLYRILWEFSIRKSPEPTFPPPFYSIPYVFLISDRGGYLLLRDFSQVCTRLIHPGIYLQGETDTVIGGPRGKYLNYFNNFLFFRAGGIALGFAPTWILRNDRNDTVIRLMNYGCPIWLSRRSPDTGSGRLPTRALSITLSNSHLLTKFRLFLIQDSRG